MQKKTEKILKFLGQQHQTLGITFVTDATIAKLNSKYRGKKGPTDVLSFSFSSPQILGDLVISSDTVKRQAKELKISHRQRNLVLIIHGILHLLGYDHVKEKDWIVMSRKEEVVWKAVQKD